MSGLRSTESAASLSMCTSGGIAASMTTFIAQKGAVKSGAPVGQFFTVAVPGALQGIAGGNWQKQIKVRALQDHTLSARGPQHINNIDFWDLYRGAQDGWGSASHWRAVQAQPCGQGDRGRLLHTSKPLGQAAASTIDTAFPCMQAQSSVQLRIVRFQPGSVRATKLCGANEP